MNRVILCGKLTREPEVRYSQTASGSMAVAKYTLAVDRAFKKDGEQAADFINCIAFGKNGEFAEKYLHQGTKIIVEGRWQTGNYTNKDGRKSTLMIVLLKDTNFAKVVLISRTIITMELWAVMLVQTALCQFQMM